MVDVFTVLRSDHRHVEELLSRLEESDKGAERDALVRELTEALTVHMQFEEQRLYPMLAPLDGEGAEEAGIEHGLARDGLAKLAELSAAPGFGAAVEMLTGGIDHHVKEEESEVFPKLRAAYDSDTLVALAAELKQAKSDAGLPPFDPRHVTKGELLDLARDAGIDGRSTMTKTELRRALERAGAAS